MATTIGLGIEFTANASGMSKGLSQVDRALKNLGSQASRITSLFDDFASSSAAAAKAQQQVATDIGFLGSALKTGQIGTEQYARELKTIVRDATLLSEAFSEGVRVTQENATAEENRANKLARLNQLLEVGAINEETYQRAKAKADGSSEAAASAEDARAKAIARAAQITEQNLSPIKRFEAALRELVALKKQDLITQETYNAALDKLRAKYTADTIAAKKFGDAIGGQGLKFNELSGALAVLPGSLGNIAGRLSGFASAGEGLARVFGGGLSKGFSALATSAVGIVNPLTLGVAGLAGFGAAASAVFANLTALSERLDSLAFEAERIGVSFEFVQVLDEAAKRSGTSVEALGAGLQKFAANVAEARTGSGAAAAAFAQLGISQQQLANADVATTAQLTSAALAKIEDPAQRAALQVATLGKAGEDLRRGFSAIGESQSALQRFAGTLDQVDAERVRDFGRSFNDLKAAFASAGNNLTTPFAGLASGVTQATAEVIGSFGRLGGAVLDLASPFLDGIGLIIDIFGRGIAGVVNFISAFIEPLAAAFRRVSATIQEAGKWLDKVTFGASGKIAKMLEGDTQRPMGAKQIEEMQRAIDGANDAFGRAAESASEYGTAGQQAVDKYRQGLDDITDLLKTNQISTDNYARGLKYLEDQFKREMKAAREAAKAEDERRRAIEQAIEADRKAADASIERMQVDTQFGGDKERFDAAKTLEAIQRETLRVEEEIAKAREAGDQAAVDAGNRRLAQLDQAAARERDIASGAAKAAEQRAKLEREYAKQRMSLEESIAIAFRRPTEPLKLEDTRTASGYEALQRFSQDQSQDPALEEYRKQLRELQKIRAAIENNEAGAETVDILGA